MNTTQSKPAELTIIETGTGRETIVPDMTISNLDALALYTARHGNTLATGMAVCGNRGWIVRYAFEALPRFASRSGRTVRATYICADGDTFARTLGA